MKKQIDMHAVAAFAIEYAVLSAFLFENSAFFAKTLAIGFFAIYNKIS